MEDIDCTDTLLVLGNGFDLHCGLPSSFLDYYETVCRALLENYYICFSNGAFEEAETLVTKSNNVINIWSLLMFIQFYARGSIYKILGVTDTNWFDIEDLIRLALTKDIHIFSKLEDYLRIVFDNLKVGCDNIRLKQYEGHRNNPYVVLPCLQHSKETNIYQYLMSELHKFENSFKDYLTAKLNNNYYQRCYDFISELTDDVSEDVDILNFNYTRVNGYTNVHNQINIHGTLAESEVVIGIDSDEIKDPSLYQFTKTYRNLHRYKKPFELPKDIDNIIFYGHSLSDADFSYFYSLFDMYDLSNSNLKLMFEYSDYDDSVQKNEINHAKYVEQIYKMINKYSLKAKSDNNLLHRLLLEGRIIIEKV